MRHTVLNRQWLEGATIMAKTLSCRDVGVDCDWHACAETEDEVLALGAQHAREDHGMTELSDEMIARAKAAIKEGPCPTSVH
jgi:predicted small metal-binding protein